jgi:hypothetical protein
MWTYFTVTRCLALFLLFLYARCKCNSIQNMACKCISMHEALLYIIFHSFCGSKGLVRCFLMCSELCHKFYSSCTVRSFILLRCQQNAQLIWPSKLNQIRLQGVCGVITERHFIAPPSLPECSSSHFTAHIYPYSSLCAAQWSSWNGRPVVVFSE